MKIRALLALILGLVASTTFGVAPVRAATEAPLEFNISYTSGRRWLDSASSSDGKTMFAVGSLFPVDPIWKSTDGGLSFSEIASAPDGWASRVDMSSDGQIVYVVYGMAPSTFSVLRSLDGGETWAAILSGLGPINDLAVSNDGRIVVMALSSGASVYFSSDSGDNWDTTLTSPGISRLDISGDGTRIVGVGGQFAYVSTDSAATWSTTTVSTHSLASDVSVSSDGSHVLMGTAAGSDGDAWVSHDGGASFTPAGFSSDYGSSVQSVTSAMSDDGQTMLWSYYGSTVRMSRDAGETWTNLVDVNEFGWMTFAVSANGLRGLLGVEASSSIFFARTNPAISEVNPVKGTKEAVSEIRVTGAFFADDCTVYLDGTALETTVVDSMKLKAVVTPIGTTSGNVEVRCGGSFVSEALSWEYTRQTTTPTESSTTSAEQGNQIANSGAPTNAVPATIFALFLMFIGFILWKMRQPQHDKC